MKIFIIYSSTTKANIWSSSAIASSMVSKYKSNKPDELNVSMVNLSKCNINKFVAKHPDAIFFVQNIEKPLIQNVLGNVYVYQHKLHLDERIQNLLDSDEVLGKRTPRYYFLGEFDKKPCGINCPYWNFLVFTDVYFNSKEEALASLK